MDSSFPGPEVRHTARFVVTRTALGALLVTRPMDVLKPQAGILSIVAIGGALAVTIRSMASGQVVVPATVILDARLCHQRTTS